MMTKQSFHYEFKICTVTDTTWNDYNGRIIYNFKRENQNISAFWPNIFLEANTSYNSAHLNITHIVKQKKNNIDKKQLISFQKKNTSIQYFSRFYFHFFSENPIRGILLFDKVESLTISLKKSIIQQCLSDLRIFSFAVG